MSSCFIFLYYISKSQMGNSCFYMLRSSILIFSLFSHLTDHKYLPRRLDSKDLYSSWLKFCLETYISSKSSHSRLTLVDRCGPFQHDCPLSYIISRYLSSSGPTQLFQVPNRVSAPPDFGLCVTC